MVLYGKPKRKRCKVLTDIIEVTNDVDEDTLKGRFLTFLLGNVIYGIQIRYVTEIVGIQAITEMPEMPNHIKGIINLRGVIIPVMDVRLRFSMNQKEYDDRTCVIVVDFTGVSIGLIVDSVSEVINLAEESIVEPPHTSIGLNNRYVKNIGKVGSNVLLLLDCEKLLSAVEIQDLSDTL